MAPLARVAVLAAAGVGLAWLLSWSVVEGLLAARARDDLSAYAGGASPWAWAFEREGDVVRPGSEGLGDARHEHGALALVVRDHAALSLNLRGRALPLGVMDALQVRATSDQPLRMVLLASTPDLAPQVVATGTLEPGGRPLRLSLAGAPPLTAAAVTLRIESTRPAQVRVEHAAFVPDPALPAPAHVCPGLAGALETATACSERIPIVQAPAFRRVESLLAWRDALLASAPTAIVLPRHRVPGRVALYGATRGPLAPWLLLAASALTLGWAGWRRLGGGNDARRQGLLFWLLPAIALLALGYPAVETPWPVALAFVVILAAALMNPAGAPPPRLLGGARAWLRALAFTVAGLSVVVALATFAGHPPEWPRWQATHEARLGRYAVWAALQQLLLLHAIVPPLRERAGHAAVACVAAGIAFALLHTPNFGLMLCTMAAGTCWAWLGLRERALLPLVASHIVLGSALILLLPPEILRNAETGARFLVPIAY